MIDVAVVLIAAFLKHAEHGVNEMAQSLPRNKWGGGIMDVPRLVKIFDDVEDDAIAEDLDPPEVPALIVWGDSAGDAPANKLYRISKNVIVAAAYVTETGDDNKQCRNECGLVLRGAMLSLMRYNNQANSAGFREFNGIKVHEITSATDQRMTAAVGARKMWGVLQIRAVVGETFQ